MGGEHANWHCLLNRAKLWGPRYEFEFRLHYPKPDNEAEWLQWRQILCNWGLPNEEHFDNEDWQFFMPRQWRYGWCKELDFAGDMPEERKWRGKRNQSWKERAWNAWSRDGIWAATG